MAKQVVTDEQIRQWILADAGLYAQAREFGGGGDDDMYAAMPRFIDANRAKLTEHIRARLTRADKQATVHTGDWGHLPHEPCRHCRVQGKVYFLIDDGPAGRSAAQTVRCDACGRSWEADSSSA